MNNTPPIQPKPKKQLTPEYDKKAKDARETKAARKQEELVKAVNRRLKFEGG